MPYLAMDLDAFENCAHIGNGCGLRAEQVSHGLLSLWRHCWREKTDRITTAHLSAFFFGSNPCEMLVTFGHLEATEAGWRVRGVAKWLKVQVAQSEAGKAHSGNLKRGRKDLQKAENPPGGLRLSSGSPSGSPPALAASSQQPTATKAKALAGLKPPADPRLRPLTETLVSVYDAVRRTKYRHSGPKDAQALKSLLSVADDAEILGRWRIGLTATGWASCSTFAQLAAKWNDLAAPAPPAKGSVIHGQTPWGPDDDFATGLAGGNP